MVKRKRAEFDAVEVSTIKKRASRHAPSQQLLTPDSVRTRSQTATPTPTRTPKVIRTYGKNQPTVTPTTVTQIMPHLNPTPTSTKRKRIKQEDDDESPTRSLRVAKPRGRIVESDSDDEDGEDPLNNLSPSKPTRRKVAETPVTARMNTRSAKPSQLSTANKQKPSPAIRKSAPQHKPSTLTPTPTKLTRSRQKKAPRHTPPPTTPESPTVVASSLPSEVDVDEVRELLEDGEAISDKDSLEPLVTSPAEHMHCSFASRKQAILTALSNLQDIYDLCDHAETDGDEIHANTKTASELSDLLIGTTTRGEGNSCLILGPRGSGKTKLVESCLSKLPEAPITIRLSGWAQVTDRLAMREIAAQLTQQTGTSYLVDADRAEAIDDDINPFLDSQQISSSIPSSHLPTLISVLPTLSRPTVIILDAFDLFAEHPRQSLLYCLLDTAQSCRAGQGQKGLAVVGVTSRIDTINLLEKRVKSRFSGRMLRTAGSRSVEDWKRTVEHVLTTPLPEGGDEQSERWQSTVQKFVSDKSVKDALHGTFSLNRDLRLLLRLLEQTIISINSEVPTLDPTQFTESVSTQRSRPSHVSLHQLPYPSMCLLIATAHSAAASHEFVTFEQLFESFHKQVRTSKSAPVQIQGGSIAMVSCSREVMMSAFEQLVNTRVFTPTTPYTPTVSKAFAKHRCTIAHYEIAAAVEKSGQTILKKWMKNDL